MKKYTLFDYLQTFDVSKDFFDIGERTQLEYFVDELVFKSQNSGLLTKFKKQTIPFADVFPKNRKKIYISLDTFESGNYANLYGIGSPQQVEKNYTKAINEISNKIHKKIQKKVSKGEDYEDAFYEESEQEFTTLHHKYGKILEKYKIFEHQYGGGIEHDDLNYYMNTSDEMIDYTDDSKFLSEIFSEFREAYFVHPYNKKNQKRLGLIDYFYLKYKRYSFMFSLDVLTETRATNTEIKI